MSRVHRIMVLGAAIFQLIALPAVDLNEWLPPDIVMEALKLGAPMKDDKAGQTSTIPAKNINAGGMAERSAIPIER